MIITTITAVISKPLKQGKSKEQISKQMERIYKLYGQGYGTSTMLRECENRAYNIFMQIEY